MPDLWHRLRPGARRPRRVATKASPRGRAAARFSLGPDRRKERGTRRSIPWRRLGLTVATTVTAVAIVYALTWLVMGDSLRVRDVHVQGAEVSNPLTIAAAAGLGGESMLLLDAETAAARVAALPAVKDAHVSRRWPQAVAITLIEHQAWGFWQSGGDRYAVDLDGALLDAYRPRPAGRSNGDRDRRRGSGRRRES